MIVEFSVKNFRSFKDLQTLSFVATGLKSSDEYKEVDTNNICHEDGLRILKTIGIYGANGSGKSNIIKALEYFLQVLKNEASSESNLKDLCEPFLYQDDAETTESFFQIVININNKKYRYGFTVKKNLAINSIEKESKEIVTSEWLYGTKEKKAGEFFIRNGMEVEKDTMPDQERIPSLPYGHTLFLVHAAAFDRDGICAQIRKFLRSFTISNFQNSFENFRWNSLYLLEQESRKADFLALLSTFNLNYDDVILERDSNKPDEGLLPHEKIYFLKKFKNKNNQNIPVRLNLSDHESAGTQKIFDIAGLVLRAFGMGNNGGLVIIDEVDSNFHPSLLIKLVCLFNTVSTNKSHTQLLFTSHDTNLMSPSIMRRDQFYFTEKGDDNSTRLYSLADLKGIRNDADFAKQYLSGIYGALPILENFSNKFELQNEGTLESQTR